jgi:peroxiredoxin
MAAVYATAVRIIPCDRALRRTARQDNRVNLQSRARAVKVERCRTQLFSMECLLDSPRCLMRATLAGLIAVGLTLGSVRPARSGEGDVKPEARAAAAKPEVPPGHSLHGEAFNEGPRQKPYLMSGTGAVHFPITTRVPLAQQYFDQGVGQLHGFWYFEAERSFRQVAALDPDCAMAYWGMAMANTNNDKRAKDFVKKAVDKKTGATPREAAWIDALDRWYAAADNTERRRKYVQDLESLVHDDPNDIEAKAFLALQIWKNGSWMTDKQKQLPIASHQAVDAILDQVFAVQPMHPAHHYRIHLWDYEKAARALVSASLCGQTSPAIAHMWHMPGHIFSKLHRYADAVWQQEASARVDHAHMMRDSVLPDQIHNYAHNNEWLIRNLAYLGRVRDGIDLAANMISLPRHPKYNTLEKGGASAAFGQARLVDLLVQFECWDELAGDLGRLCFEGDKDNVDDKLKRARLTGLAAFGLGKTAEGRQQIAAIEALVADNRAARAKAADEAEAKAVAAGKSEADIAKAMAEAMQSHGATIRKLERASGELKTYDALAAGQAEQAKRQLETLQKSPDVRKDQLARLYSLVGDHAQAETTIRQEVQGSPGQMLPQAVLVEVLFRANKKAEAKAELEKLRPLAAFADLDLRVCQRLKPIAQEFGLPEDWRGSRAPAADVGMRPELATLGPFRWGPTPATSWSLPGADGQNVSLDDYRGRPVVMILYLGSGCLHCVEQIQKFAPLASDYAAAGISIVAISSEPLDILKGSLTKLSPQETIPFRLAADPQMQVFKNYRAFDDFENMPLHATFLVDGNGLVRWQDISFEPFSDPKFLLEEAKRLLGTP